MKISAIALAFSLFLQGPFSPLRSAYVPAGAPPPSSPPSFNQAASCHDHSVCTASVTAAGSTLLVGTITMGSATANSVTDTNGIATSVASQGFTAGYNGDVHLFIEVNAATGNHTVTLNPPSGTTMSNMWVAVIEGASTTSPIDAGPVTDGRSGTVDSLSCPTLTSTTANILAITWWGLPGALFPPTASSGSNLPNVAEWATVGPGPGTYSDQIAWQFASFSAGPGSIIPKVDLSSTNPAGGCVAVVLKA